MTLSDFFTGFGLGMMAGSIILGVFIWRSKR